MLAAPSPPSGERGFVEHRGKAHPNSASSGLLPSCPPPGGHLHSGYRAGPPSAGALPTPPQARVSLAEPGGAGSSRLNFLSPPGTSRRGSLAKNQFQ